MGEIVVRLDGWLGCGDDDGVEQGQNHALSTTATLERQTRPERRQKREMGRRKRAEDVAGTLERKIEKEAGQVPMVPIWVVLVVAVLALVLCVSCELTTRLGGAGSGVKEGREGHPHAPS